MLFKIRSWLDHTLGVRYRIIPLLLCFFIFFLLKINASMPWDSYDYTAAFIFSCIPAGWHTFNYIKLVLTYREKNTAERLINYYEQRRHYSLTIQLIKWVIKGVISFFIGVPSLFYLLYQVFQETKQLKNRELDV